MVLSEVGGDGPTVNAELEACTVAAHSSSRGWGLEGRADGRLPICHASMSPVACIACQQRAAFPLFAIFTRFLASRLLPATWVPGSMHPFILGPPCRLRLYMGLSWMLCRRACLLLGCWPSREPLHCTRRYGLPLCARRDGLTGKLGCPARSCAGYLKMYMSRETPFSRIPVPTLP